MFTTQWISLYDWPRKLHVYMERGNFLEVDFLSVSGRWVVSKIEDYMYIDGLKTSGGLPQHGN